ncbi:MAG: response regulator [Magnetococcales bacterium]|nr:response regulator [Magnetococcales bacterium]MBF0115327.1 response regulator [Magnetococcales bacterium]
MSNSNKPRVLIVDDNAGNLKILLELLHEDYAVKVAKSGSAALQQALAAPRPDIILLDIMMPEIDGFEVCMRLKSNPETWSIPVLFITALDQDTDQERGLTIGAVDYITKPFNPVLVKARVRSQIDLKQHRDKLAELVDERTQQLAETQDITIQALATLAETRDPETGGHIKRTQSYVGILARALASLPEFAAALSPENIGLLEKSAPLHDVGKVGVPDHILLKPGKLSEEEFAVMKNHCLYGLQAMKAAQKTLGKESFLRYAAEIAGSHHEKWDGSGYPHGLCGDAIPLSGRIMAVADVYDALISKRVYKPPFPHSKALAILSEGSGSHFDPRIVQAMLANSEAFRQTALEFADYPEERAALQPLA